LQKEQQQQQQEQEQQQQQEHKQHSKEAAACVLCGAASRMNKTTMQSARSGAAAVRHGEICCFILIQHLAYRCSPQTQKHLSSTVVDCVMCCAVVHCRTC
jgi:hypothetical protein